VAPRIAERSTDQARALDREQVFLIPAQLEVGPAPLLLDGRTAGMLDSRLGRGRGGGRGGRSESWASTTHITHNVLVGLTPPPVRFRVQVLTQARPAAVLAEQVAVQGPPLGRNTLESLRLPPRQEEDQRVRLPPVSPGPARLLGEVYQGRRLVNVHDQADVGVVEAGAERSRSDDIRLVCGGEPRSH